jgi:hypothetical protein
VLHAGIELDRDTSGGPVWTERELEKAMLIAGAEERGNVLESVD